MLAFLHCQSRSMFFRPYPSCYSFAFNWHSRLGSWPATTMWSWPSPCWGLPCCGLAGACRCGQFSALRSCNFVYFHVGAWSTVSSESHRAFYGLFLGISIASCSRGIHLKNSRCQAHVWFCWCVLRAQKAARTASSSVACRPHSSHVARVLWSNWPHHEICRNLSIFTLRLALPASTDTLIILYNFFCSQHTFVSLVFIVDM